jgi:hypothetical protein
MIIQFQNTYEDYREAAASITADRRQRMNTPARAIGFIAAFVAYYLLARWLWSFTSADSLVIWIHLLVPSAAIMLVGIFLGAIAVLWPSALPRPTWRMVLSIVVLIGLCFQIWYFSRGLPPRKRGAPPITWETFLPHSTWLFMMVSIMAISILNRVTQLRRQWETQPALARPKTAEVTAHGITITDAFVKSESVWPGFEKCEETKHLFLLFTGTGPYFMIPKRAFGSTEELDAMRTLLNLIKSPRSAFQVVPVAAAVVPAQN